MFSKIATRSYATKVAAKDSASKVSTLAVKVHAGSRYATKDGVSHLLSRFNFHNTQSKSALRLVRESELLGGRFASSVDREFITLKTTFLKEDLPYFVEALGNVLYKTSFRPHELVESVLPAAKHDLLVAQASPATQARDALYQVTYRKDLGNALLYDGVEKVALQDIVEYADKVYTQANIEIVGQGVNPADLQRFINDSAFTALPAGSSLVASAEPKAYTGQETRIRAQGESVAAIAVPVSVKDFATYEVLARYLNSALSDLPVSGAQLDKYSNAGLFTLTVQGAAAEVSANIMKVVASLKAGKDLSAAIPVAKLQLAVENESSFNAVELALDSAKSFKLQGFNYVAVGDVNNLPFADEL